MNILYRKPPISEIIRISLIAFLLVINAAALLWYIFDGYKLFFHSDSATKVLLAREIIETGQYFPKDWNYVNKDLFVLFGHTFIIPLLYFLPAGYFVHALSGLVSGLLILSGVWLVSSLLTISKFRRTLILLVILAGISGFLAENLYGQVSYGAIFYCTCYVIYFSWKFLESSGGKQAIYGVALFVSIVLVFWANPTRAVITYGLPLLWAVIHNIIISISTSGFAHKNVRTGCQLVTIIFMSAALGALLHSKTLLEVNNIAGAGTALWLSVENMAQHLVYTLKGFLAIFGGLPNVNSPLATISGAYQLIRFFSALILLVLIPFSLWKTLTQKGPGAQFFASFTVVAVILVLLVQLTTTVPDMRDPVQSARYLIPSLLLSLIVVLAQSWEFQKQPVTTLVSAGIIAVFATSSYTTYFLSNLSSGINFGMHGQHSVTRPDLKNFLTANNLEYGYSSYWNASVMSVLSEEEVLIRQIGIERNLPMPMRHLSSNRWYQTEGWHGETFLMLTAAEASTIDWELMKYHDAIPVRELAFDNFKIFVFRNNLASRLPGWDQRYLSPFSFNAWERSLRQIGRYHKTFGSKHRVLVADVGEKGALQYGPYINVDPGTYVVTFHVSASESSKNSIRIDVSQSTNQKILAEKNLRKTNGEAQLRFTVNSVANVEFRVWSLGNAQVIFESVSIVRDKMATSLSIPKQQM